LVIKAGEKVGDNIANQGHCVRGTEASDILERISDGIFDNFPNWVLLLISVSVVAAIIIVITLVTLLIKYIIRKRKQSQSSTNVIIKVSRLGQIRRRTKYSAHGSG
jgi:hypothetical protein